MIEMAFPYRPVAPTPPDFHLCSIDYGRLITGADCFEALNMLPGGSGMIRFQVQRSFPDEWNPTGLPLIVESGRYHLFFSLSVIKTDEVLGDCRINVEVAGPNPPETMLIVPNNLRSMASYVINRCVVLRGGYGGFITSGLSHLVNYVVERNLMPNFAVHEWRKGDPFCRFNIIRLKFGDPSDRGVADSTSFITITVTTSDSPKSGMAPGNTDPSIADAIGNYMNAATNSDSKGAGQASQLRKIRSIGGQMWELAAAGMIRSGSTTWWLSASRSLADDEMTYECDTSLGSPAVADCSQVEWSQLGPPSDTVTVGPNNVQFMHSSESQRQSPEPNVIN